MPWVQSKFSLNQSNHCWPLASPTTGPTPLVGHGAWPWGCWGLGRRQPTAQHVLGVAGTFLETSSNQPGCRAKLAKSALPPQQHQDPRRPPHHLWATWARPWVCLGSGAGPPRRGRPWGACLGAPWALPVAGSLPTCPKAPKMAPPWQRGPTAQTQATPCRCFCPPG